MNYQLEMTNCPLCGGNNYKPYIVNAKELYGGTDNFFTVVKCCDCEMVFTNPRPDKDSISFFYPDSAGYYQPPVSAPKWDDSFKEKLLKPVLAHFYDYDFKTVIPKPMAYFLKKVLQRKIDLAHIPRFVSNGSLLDIGSSWGLYLSRMAAYGWQVWGVEMNKNTAEYAQNTLGLKNIFNGSFDSYNCEENFFDVVHMSMVLEHLYDPAECLKRVYKILKKNGQLIVSVPDISGFEAKIYGQYAYTLQVPQHLCHFSPKTIKNLMAKSGFTVKKIVHQNFDRDMVASSQYLKNNWLAGILTNRIIRTLAVKPFVFALAVLGKTSRMSIYAAK